MPDSGWTVDTLHEHVKEGWRLRDENVKTAVEALDKRLDTMNEFRSTITDQALTFMPRSEALTAREAFDERLSDVKSRLDRAEGRTTALAIILPVLMAVATFGGIWLNASRAPVPAPSSVQLPAVVPR